MSFILVDILPIKSGATVNEAVEYFDGLKPVFQRHGLTRIDAPLKAVKAMRGDVPADLVNLFETENPEASLMGMRDDPDYQAQATERDRIFDLERASILLTKRH